MLEAGRLRNQIVIQSPAAETQDAHNQETTPYTDSSPAWAEVLGLSGKQLAIAQAGTETSTSTHSITMRWCAVRPMIDRIKFTAFGVTRYFDVNSALDPDGTRTELRIMATERTG